MQKVELAQIILAAQAQIGNDKGLRDHAREMTLRGGHGGGGLFGGQRARQSQMKLKLFHNIGIAIYTQQLTLPRGQQFWPAAGDFGHGQRRAVRVKRAHHFGSQILQISAGRGRDQGQEPLKQRQLQRGQGDGLHTGGKLLGGLLHLRNIHTLGQPKWRLYGGVKAVFARGLGDILPAQHARRGHGAATGQIPTKPRGRSARKSACWRRIINRISVHLHHSCAAYPPNVTSL